MVGTRSSNSQSHLGRIVAPKTRRSSQEVTDSKEAAKRVKERKASEKSKQLETLVEIEIGMQDQETTTRALCAQCSKKGPDAGPGKGANAASGKAAQAKPAQRKKRKRSPSPAEVYTDDEEEDAMEVETEDKAGLTPLNDLSEDSEPEGASDAVESAGSQSGSQYDEGQGGGRASDEDSSAHDVGETPNPPKKKPKIVKESLRDNVQAAKASKAKAPVPGRAPDANTATAKKPPPKEMASMTENSSTGRSASRTQSTPATPYTAGGGTQAGKAPGATRPRGRPSDAEATVRRQPDTEVEGTGFAATDDEGVEAEAAKNSPVKNRARLASTACHSCGPVKVSTVDLTTPTRKSRAKADTHKKSRTAQQGKSAKSASPEAIEINDSENDDAPPPSKNTNAGSRPTAKNSDLPEGVMKNGLWKKQFMPTFLRYLGTLPNCWNVPDATLLQVLQTIWDTVYGDSLPRVLDSNDIVVAVALQRMYEWRAGIGSAGLRAFENFFRTNPTKFSSVGGRSAYCASILNDCQLLYENPESDERHGLYQSHFVISCLAAHIEAIQGAVDVPGLYASARDAYPYGAIGLAASATYRAAHLWQLRRVTYDKENRPVAQKAVNALTGKDSTKDVEFSIANYGAKTAGGATSSRALPLPSLELIVSLALECSQPSAASCTKTPAQKNGEVDFSALFEVPR